MAQDVAESFCIEVTLLGKTTLNAVPCPECKGPVEGIVIEEESITNAKRVPVLVPAKCSNGHNVILFVDKQFTVRDVETAGAVVDGDSEGSVDKARKWMDSF
ncbi:MAG: hypothetical protein ACFFEK_11370 [Candidatus Thorarchaeota archaeon]